MARKILFRHMRAPGDVLMFTAGIRDFKKLFPEILINAECNKDFFCLFDNNPYIDPSVKKGDSDVEVYNVGYPTIQGCNDGFVHFTMAFLLDMISQADAHKSLPISLGEFCASFCSGGDGNLRENGSDAKEPFISWGKKYKGFTGADFEHGGKANERGAYRQYGDLHLDEHEKNYNAIKELYNVDKYWVIAPGGKRDCTCKIWDWRRFQKVIDFYDGLIKFVVVGRRDHLLERNLRGVISLVDKTPSIRDLIPLVYHSEGVVSGVSFLMHLAGAIGSNNPRYPKSRKPCVSIYGGREPGSFTWYCGHQVLHTNGVISCCDNGGCWQSRHFEIAKDPEHNKRFCHNTVVCDGRTIQKCMDLITAEDVIRAIGKYYEGDLYSLAKPVKTNLNPQIASPKSDIKVIRENPPINMLASLQSSGGGEQSALKIALLLKEAGWDLRFFAWDSIHPNYKEMCSTDPAGAVVSFKSGGMLEKMGENRPLLFYANDQIWDFCKEDLTGEIIKRSSSLVININFATGTLKNCPWLIRSGKIKGIIFHNHEKLEEFRREQIGMDNVPLVPLFGAIDLDTYYQLPICRRENKEQLVILKHCKPDYRKYVTTKSENNGKKIHVWQKDSIKENDIKFYSRLLNDLRFKVRFEFMEAHPEIVEHFKNDSRMVFHKWDSMSVPDFLKRGHLYLYRTSNMWRDNYPRCVAEAVAAGLPVLTEPRDGTFDRVRFGDTGFYCMDYDQFKEAIIKLHRKENYRFNMGRYSKEWARDNLDPKCWIDVLGKLLYEA